MRVKLERIPEDHAMLQASCKKIVPDNGGTGL